MAFTRVTVLAGGISHERDVSLRTGRQVADALQAHGLRVDLRDPDATLLPALTADRPDVVWPALHGASGDDGALRGLLGFLGIPFVGARAEAARLAWDKPTAKALVGRAGIATPRSIALGRDAFRELGADAVFAAITEEIPFPLVVKPAQGGSALGITIVRETAQLARAMVDAYTYWDVALVEQHIAGVELGVGIIDTGDGPVALPAVEIVPESGLYGYEERYNPGLTRFYAPGRLTDDIAARVADAALTAHRTLGLRHISRVDLIVDRAGTPWFLEASVMPGLTETSIVPLALEAAGHDRSWVYARIAEAALADG